MCVLGVGERSSPRFAFRATFISSVTLGKLPRFSEPEFLGHDTRATIPRPASQQDKGRSELCLACVRHLANVHSTY